MKQDIKHIIDEFVEQLRMKFQENILAVKLYGSYARGDSTNNSDIDVLVVVKDASLEKKLKIMDVSADISLKYNTLLVALIMSQKHYDKGCSNNSLLIKKIEREGVELWAK